MYTLPDGMRILMSHMRQPAEVCRSHCGQCGGSGGGGESSSVRREFGGWREGMGGWVLMGRTI